MNQVLKTSSVGSSHLSEHELKQGFRDTLEVLCAIAIERTNNFFLHCIHYHTVTSSKKTIPSLHKHFFLEITNTRNILYSLTYTQFYN